MAATTASLPPVDLEAVDQHAPAETLNLDPLIESLTVRARGADARRSVRTAVEEAAREFDAAPIRTFLPLLIHKRAEHQLRARGVIPAIGKVA